MDRDRVGEQLSSPGAAGTPCPTDDVLGALVHHALPPDEAAQVAAHLDHCVSCQQIAIAAMRGGVAPPHELSVTAPSNVANLLWRTPTGTRIGRYALRGLLGVGGMGAVYDAHDTELDRPVALKVLRPELGDEPGLADRLVRESRLMARVAHPSVITVYDVGRAGDVVFIAMELIRGSTLTARLASRTLEWRAIVALFERAGHGLAAAHGAGIVHRDFKPDNVLVSSDAGKVVVTDFGIARDDVAPPQALALAGGTPHPRPRGSDSHLTTEGAVIGTPAYMAPEQLAGGPVDLRADVFAFSVSLWHAVFRERPFPGTSLAEILAMLRQPPRPPANGPRVPGRLVRALQRGLAASPADRWPDMPAMLAELAAIRTRPRRYAMAASAAGLIGLGIAGVLAVARPAAVDDPCARAEAQLAAAYPPALEASVRAALDGDRAVQTEVLARLGGRRDAWRTTERATCRADRPVAQDARITACLDARRTELAGTVDDLIANGPAGTADARRISRIPADPALCVDPAPGLLFARVPVDRALRRQVTALRGRIAAAHDASDRAEFQRAIDLVTPVVGEAAAVWPPLHAEALLELGMDLRQGADLKLAIATLLQAASTAESAHHDDIAAKSWNQLVQAAAFDQGDPSHALEYAAYADAAIDRIGRPRQLVMRFQYARGIALVGASRWKEAEAALRTSDDIAETTSAEARAYTRQGLGILYESQGRFVDAVAMFRQALEQVGDREEGRAYYLQRLAANLDVLGQRTEAATAAREAVEISDRMLPETHRDRPGAHLQLAEILQDVGLDREALVEAHGAVAVFARTQGPRSERYGEALYIHGQLLDHLGRYTEAEPLLARACEVFAFAQGDETRERALCETAHAAALTGLRRDGDALALLNHAVPLLVKSLGPVHLEVAKALEARGAARAALGDHPAAVADFTRAIAILTPLPIEPGYLAMATWQLGRERWTDEPDRARREVAAALARFATANGRWAQRRAVAAAWLAHHARR
jgi:tetratricopeptide (TPR) repeat protein